MQKGEKDSVFPNFHGLHGGLAVLFLTLLFRTSHSLSPHLFQPAPLGFLLPNLDVMLQALQWGTIGAFHPRKVHWICLIGYKAYYPHSPLLNILKMEFIPLSEPSWMFLISSQNTLSTQSFKTSDLICTYSSCLAPILSLFYHFALQYRTLSKSTSPLYKRAWRMGSIRTPWEFVKNAKFQVPHQT